MEQPRTLITLKEVTPSLRFSRKIYKKFEILNPLKLKLGTQQTYTDLSTVSQLGHKWAWMAPKIVDFLVRDAKGLMRTNGTTFDVLLRKRA